MRWYCIYTINGRLKQLCMYVPCLQNYSYITISAILHVLHQYMRYLLTNSLSKLRGKVHYIIAWNLIFLSDFQNLVTNIHTDKTHKHTLLLGHEQMIWFYPKFLLVINTRTHTHTHTHKHAHTRSH